MAEAYNAAAAAAAYGITKELLTRFPELQPVWDKFVAEDVTEAATLYYATSYYKNLLDTSKTRELEKVSQSGVYEQKLAAYVIDQTKRLKAKGITLDETISKRVLEDSYLRGLNDNQVDVLALGSFSGVISGATQDKTYSLKNYANGFGMSYDAKTINTWSRDIFTGSTTEADIESKIRADSASAFPIYADQINKGISVDSLASAYKSSMATILEIDPDSIDYKDPALRSALQSVGADGKPSVKPLWQFEKELRSDPRWGYTDNAKATVDSLSLKVLRDWGLA